MDHGREREQRLARELEDTQQSIISLQQETRKREESMVYELNAKRQTIHELEQDSAQAKQREVKLEQVRI